MGKHGNQRKNDRKYCCETVANVNFNAIEVSVKHILL